MPSAVSLRSWLITDIRLPGRHESTGRSRCGLVDRRPSLGLLWSTASGTHPGISTSEGGDVDIPGAEDASIVNFTLEDSAENISGRWWMLVDPEQDVAVTVEYYGSDVTEEDLDRFQESLTLDSEQSW